MAAKKAEEVSFDAVTEKKNTDVYVCSAMACDNAYTTWKSGANAANDLPRKDRQVLIKGGTGVINKQLVTPYGVVTRISAEQLQLLRDNCPAFVRHEANGFLKVLENDPSEKTVVSVAADLSEDASTQATETTVKS